MLRTFPLYSELRLPHFLWLPLQPAWDGQVVSAVPPSHLKVPGELKEQRDGLAGSNPQVHTFAGQELGQPGQLPGEGAS